MKVVESVEITPARLVATNVPEDDAPAWVAGTYGQGDEVIHNRHLYRSAAADNTAEPGAETTEVLKWVDLGPINRWRMFDKRVGKRWQIGTFTTNPESVDVTIQAANVVNALGLVGLSAASVQIIMTVPGVGEVYSRTVAMTDYGVGDWYDYYFAPLERSASVALLDLPAYGNAAVQVIASAPDAVAAVGTLVLGYWEESGQAVYGTQVGFESYSAINEDDFGNVEITPRGSRDVVEFDLRIDTNRFSYVRRRLMRLRDTASLYVGNADMEGSIIVGRFDQLNIVISNPAVCEAVLEVRSLQ